MTSIALSSRPLFGPAQATLVIAIAAMCFGLVPLFARELQALGVADAAIALYRFVFTAAVTLPFLPLERYKRRQALMLGAAGLFSGLGWVGYLQAIETAPVAVAGTIYMSYPIFALGFAWLFLGQRPGWRSWSACALVLTAAGMLVGGGQLEGNYLALFLSLPAPIFFGLLIVVLSAMVPDLGALEKMACGMSGAVVGLLPLALMADPATIIPADADTWMVILGLGAITALVPQMLYTLACPVVGPARTAATGAFELPTMIAVGWFAFAETIGLIEVAAAVLVLAAIFLSPAVSPPKR